MLSTTEYGPGRPRSRCSINPVLTAQFMLLLRTEIRQSEVMRRLFSTPPPLKTITLPVLSTSSRFSAVQSRLRSPNSRIVGHKFGLISYSSTSHEDLPPELMEESFKKGPLKPGLYLVGTPIGNLEDITLRALRVLKSADVILSEDTRHSGKLLQYYSIKTPQLSYHKFNESQRAQTVLKRLKQGEVVALISDAGMPGISDPGAELTKLCVEEMIPVIPVPGPSAFVAALSASGLATDEFNFVGFLPKHAGSRKDRLKASADETTTQIFYVPPHKLCQFLEESSSFFGDLRQCVIAREITKIHEELCCTASVLGISVIGKILSTIVTAMRFEGSSREPSEFLKFWRGTLGEAKVSFAARQPKGEITLLIEGNTERVIEGPSEYQLENELRKLISSGHSLSLAVKLVAEMTAVRRKTVYAIALRKFVKQIDSVDDTE